VKDSLGKYTLWGPRNEIADFEMDVSGYWYVWFYFRDISFIGGFDEYFFYWCYEKLKELNKPMDDSTNEYFNNQDKEDLNGNDV
jgi:hypothetical protein